MAQGGVEIAAAPRADLWKQNARPTLCFVCDDKRAQRSHGPQRHTALPAMLSLLRTCLMHRMVACWLLVALIGAALDVVAAQNCSLPNCASCLRENACDLCNTGYQVDLLSSQCISMGCDQSSDGKECFYGQCYSAGLCYQGTCFGGGQYDDGSPCSANGTIGSCLYAVCFPNEIGSLPSTTTTTTTTTIPTSSYS